MRDRERQRETKRDKERQREMKKRALDNFDTDRQRLSFLELLSELKTLIQKTKRIT